MQPELRQVQLRAARLPVSLPCVYGDPRLVVVRLRALPCTVSSVVSGWSSLVLCTICFALFAALPYHTCSPLAVVSFCRSR